MCEFVLSTFGCLVEILCAQQFIICVFVFFLNFFFLDFSFKKNILSIRRISLQYFVLLNQSFHHFERKLYSDFFCICSLLQIFSYFFLSFVQEKKIEKLFDKCVRKYS